MSVRSEEDEDEEIYFPEELDEFYENKYTKLGSGAFSKVLLAEHRGTQEMVAVKVMSKEKLKKKNNLHRFKCEVDALKILVHQNICQLFQVVESDGYISLVMEHCPGGELFDYIVSKKKLPESEARILFRQILSAVAFTHEHGIAHRDIKPENMLLNNEKSIKMIDFGLSVKPVSGLGVPLLTRVGSPAYAAPELVSGELYYGNQTDVWSLGVALYAILCGRLPFDEDTTEELYEEIKKGEYFKPKHLSKGSAKLISKMLEVNPKKRITVPELLEDDWVTNGKELERVTSESSLPVSSVDEKLAEQVATALGISLENVTKIIEKKEYDNTMAHYLILSKKKEDDVRKFQLIYGLSTENLEQLRLLGPSNTNLTTRQRSKTEQRGLFRMIDGIDTEDGRFLDTEEVSGSKKGKGHWSLPRRKISSQEPSRTPFLTINESPQTHTSQELERHHQNDLTKSRSITINDSKSRSGSRLNELVSAVFKLEEKPRKVKGFYHMGNTSTKYPEDVRKELARVLENLPSYYDIASITNPKRFLFRVKALDSEGKKMTCEIEICAIPKVDNVVGIRNKRLNGNIWFYKRLVEDVFTAIKL
ncbi:maternal embryonic leucine zipper kinase-like isoform X2 [Rhopilema esculentum]|uniref:maternal embryonic leucine zipper kinase-like isoform X2 n=1 Tax=Rhopilema esculentum TaxID=499914 RepID=UPI0031DC962C